MNFSKLKNKQTFEILKKIGNPSFEEMRNLQKSPKVPKSQAPILARQLFNQFSKRGQNKLYPEELLNIHKYLEAKFKEEFQDLKPNSLFKTLELDDEGCASLDDFELWIMLYMTYDDEVDFLLNKQLLIAQAYQKQKYDQQVGRQMLEQYKQCQIEKAAIYREIEVSERRLGRDLSEESRREYEMSAKKGQSPYTEEQKKLVLMKNTPIKSPVKMAMTSNTLYYDTDEKKRSRTTQMTRNTLQTFPDTIVNQESVRGIYLQNQKNESESSSGSFQPPPLSANRTQIAQANNRIIDPQQTFEINLIAQKAS